MFPLFFTKSWYWLAQHTLRRLFSMRVSFNALLSGFIEIIEILKQEVFWLTYFMEIIERGADSAHRTLWCFLFSYIALSQSMTIDGSLERPCIIESFLNSGQPGVTLNFWGLRPGTRICISWCSLHGCVIDVLVYFVHVINLVAARSNDIRSWLVIEYMAELSADLFCEKWDVAGDITGWWERSSWPLFLFSVAESDFFEFL